MKKLAEKSWDWTLYEHDGRLYLSVLCGGVAMFDLDIELNGAEVHTWNTSGEAGLKPLIDRMRDYPREFADRKARLPDIAG